MVLEDELNKHLNFKNGFYIECGANDGIFQTNTLKLESKGWSGILIEASTQAYDKCIKNRNLEKNLILNCALVSNDYNNDSIHGDFDGHPMGSVDGNRLHRNPFLSINARTIDSILKENNISKVDLFIIDVEGYELNVLKGIDFNYCSPTYFCIEVYTNDKEKIDNFLFYNGYELITNLTNFNLKDDPYWDGTHNDFLYKKK